MLDLQPIRFEVIFLLNRESSGRRDERAMAESSRFASSVNDATLNSLDSFASWSAIAWGIRVLSDWATAQASTVEAAGDVPVSTQVSQALNQEHNSLQYPCTCNIVYMIIYSQ